MRVAHPSHFSEEQRENSGSSREDGVRLCVWWIPARPALNGSATMSPSSSRTASYILTTLFRLEVTLNGFPEE